MKRNIVLIILSLAVEVFAIQLWFVCQKFQDGFHFSFFDTQLKIVEKTNNDVGYSAELVRFFHNKAALGISEITNKYLFFWEPNFQALFFTFIGIFGIICGVWYLLKSKKLLYSWIILLVLLGLPFIEVFSLTLPFYFKLALLWLPYTAVSLYGLWRFLSVKSTKRRIVVLILLALSIWYLLAFQGDIFVHFCYNK